MYNRRRETFCTGLVSGRSCRGCLGGQDVERLIQAPAIWVPGLGAGRRNAATEDGERHPLRAQRRTLGSVGSDFGREVVAREDLTYVVPVEAEGPRHLDHDLRDPFSFGSAVPAARLAGGRAKELFGLGGELSHGRQNVRAQGLGGDGCYTHLLGEAVCTIFGLTAGTETDT